MKHWEFNTFIFEPDRKKTNRQLAFDVLKTALLIGVIFVSIFNLWILFAIVFLALKLGIINGYNPDNQTFRYIGYIKYFNMKKSLHKSFLIVIASAIAFNFSNCAGTINTIGSLKSNEYKNAFIISAQNSQYIKFKFLYMYFGDHTAESHEKIGNTDLVIKSELEKYGIYSEIGEDGEIPENTDLIVLYNDVWRWDFKPILDNLEIVFISPDNNEEIARATFNIYRNKEIHDFPNAEKEVPKMIEELLQN